MNGLVRRAFSRPEISDDVEKRLQPRLHAGVGGVRVNLDDQVGLRSHFGAEPRLGERVNRATEIAHAQQKQIRVLPAEGHGIEDVVREVPGGRSFSHGREAVSGDGRDAHAGEFLPHRLRSLRREGVVAVAGEQDGRFSFRHRSRQRLLTEFPQRGLRFRLGAHGGGPCFVRERTRRSQIADGHLHERRTCRVAVGEIQQRRKEADFRKRLRQKIRSGLCDRAEVGIPTIVGLRHAHDVREENQVQVRVARDPAPRRARFAPESRSRNSTSNHRAGPHPTTPPPCRARKKTSRRADTASASSAPAECRCADGSSWRWPSRRRKAVRFAVPPDRRRRRCGPFASTHFHTSCSGHRTESAGPPPRNGQCCKTFCTPGR